MNLISLEFIILAIITIIGYFIIPLKYRWIILLGASIYFYIDASVKALTTIIIVSLSVFLLAQWIEKIPNESKKKRGILSISVLGVVLWLAIVKIFSVNQWHSTLIVFPLGISYISFSLISYMVDVYWGKDKAEKNFLKFLLYIMYFPKISQGPITRYKNLSQQLYEGGIANYRNICFGAQRMVYGYFKKLVIADRATLYTDTVFGAVSNYSGSMIVLATMIAAIQLYCDFSGYMDIILGFSQMLGIEMDENFKHPFFSCTVAEFWRRWHITLGVWFKDYVYTPIAMSRFVKKIGKWGRKQKGKRFGNSLVKVIALSAVWMLTGLWHGTGWNYVIWGMYWGSVIIASTVFEQEILNLNKCLHIKTDTFLWRIFQRSRTFVFFCVGILITKIVNVHETKVIVHNIIYSYRLKDLFNGTVFTAGLNEVNFKILLCSMCVVLAISILQEKKSIRERIAGLIAPVRWIVYVLAVSIVLFIGIYGTAYSTAGFAYTNF